MAVSKSARQSPQAIIFDVGRVIIRLNPARALAPLSAALRASGGGAEPAAMAEKMWRAIQADPRWHDWQEGRMTPAQWHQHITGLLHVPLDFGDFCAAWNRALDPQPLLDPALFEILGSVCRLGLLSNTDPLHMEYMETHFSFVRLFPTRIYSCRIGVSKPNPVIFQAALRALDAGADSTLYIDDLPQFADAAGRLGFDAIRFENPAQLSRELALRGCPVPRKPQS